MTTSHIIADPDPTDLVVGLPGLEPICRARGWSLSRAAVELGEWPAQIYAWGRGRATPNARVVARLARKLSVSADALLGLAPVATA